MEFVELEPIVEARQAAKSLPCPCLSQSSGPFEGRSWCYKLNNVVGRLDL